MPRAAIALVTAALRLWSRPAAAQDWFSLPEQQDQLGDLSDAHREALQRLDPGVQGSQWAVGSAVVDQAKLLRQHGAETPKTVTIITDPERVGRLAGIKVLNATPVDSFGSQVVQTDHGPMAVPLWSFHTAWKLEDRPRRLALIVMEMQEDYRPYLGFLVPKIDPLVREFRSQGFPVFFTTWVRRPNDGLYGAADRASGVQGIRGKMNGNYIYSENGARPMKELMPTPDEIKSGYLIKSIHANKFADLDASGRSILSDKVREQGVDTVVVTGGWTDICVLSTVLDAVDTKNLDVLVVSDAVATTDTTQQPVLGVLHMAAALMNSSSLVDYMEVHKGNTSYLKPRSAFPAGLMFKSDAAPLLGLHVPLSPALCPLLLLCTVIAIVGLHRHCRRSNSEPVYTQQPFAGDV